MKNTTTRTIEARKNPRKRRAKTSPIGGGGTCMSYGAKHLTCARGLPRAKAGAKMVMPNAWGRRLAGLLDGVMAFPAFWLFLHIIRIYAAREIDRAGCRSRSTSSPRHTAAR